MSEDSNNESHKEALRETGFWGRQGAGIIPFCPTTKRFMLGLRSEECLQPLTHACFGGAVDDGETPEEAAKREKFEETGYTGKFKLIKIFVFESGDFKYHNFIMLVPEEYEPTLNWETKSTGWYKLDEFPTPLHFGIEAILADPVASEILEDLISGNMSCSF